MLDIRLCCISRSSDSITASQQWQMRVDQRMPLITKLLSYRWGAQDVASKQKNIGIECGLPTLLWIDTA